MKNNLVILCLLSALAVLNSCTTAKKPEVDAMDREIKYQTPADTPDQIMERAAYAFSNAQGLTAEQKTKLRSIYTRVYAESMQIRRDIGQSKSLLFMTLAKVDYKESEITNLKDKIVKLDMRRLDIMFKALDDVRSIVGKGIEAEKIYKHFQDFEIKNIRVRDQL
ncbi:MAG: hypothetical protein AABY53_04530 [Bdellovibrionota bacterium]